MVVLTFSNSQNNELNFKITDNLKLLISSKLTKGAFIEYEKFLNKKDLMKWKDFHQKNPHHRSSKKAFKKYVIEEVTNNFHHPQVERFVLKNVVE